MDALRQPNHHYDSLTWIGYAIRRDIRQSQRTTNSMTHGRKKFNEHQKEIVAGCEELLNAKCHEIPMSSEAEEKEFEQAVKSQCSMKGIRLRDRE